MKSLTVCIVLAMSVCAFAEPPSGYSYNRPSGGHSGGGGGGGGYQAVSSGYQSSEGQQVDGQLLEQIRQILLREESQAGAGGQGGYPSAPSSSYGAPSSSYGAPPSSSYGAPSSSYGAPAARVVGVNLEGVRQAIQVAQFEQQSSGGAGGYPSGPSSSYSAPSSSYGAPARAPSSSYGAPF